MLYIQHQRPSSVSSSIQWFRQDETLQIYFALDKSENKKSNERIEMEFATIADAKRNAEIVYW